MYGSGVSKLLLPKSVEPKKLNVLVSLCVHRALDPEIYSALTLLQTCPFMNLSVTIKHGDALIDRSRSIVASRFIQAGTFDILFFVDDDILFDPHDIVKMCSKMQEADLPILAGAYVKKQSEDTHFAVKTFKDIAYTFGKDAPVQEVEMVSTGFMAISKKVIQKMVDENVVPLCHPEDIKFYPFFQPYPKQVGGRWVYLSEDWAFCDRAKQLGFKMYVDGSVKLGHAGRYVYNWDDLQRLRGKKQEVEGINYLDKEGEIVITFPGLQKPEAREA